MINYSNTIDITSHTKDNYKFTDIARKDSSIARKIIESPNIQMKISEEDLHNALRKTSELPEDNLKRIIDDLRDKVENIKEDEKKFLKDDENTNKKLDKEKTSIISNKEQINTFENKLLTEFDKELNSSIINKFNVYLNKSLVNIAKTAKKNTDLFKNNKNFWIGLEREIMQRCDSLSNEQITEIVCAFVKQEVQEIKLFEEIEDLIIESDIPFSVN